MLWACSSPTGACPSACGSTSSRATPWACDCGVQQLPPCSTRRLYLVRDFFRFRPWGWVGGYPPRACFRFFLMVFYGFFKVFHSPMVGKGLPHLKKKNNLCSVQAVSVGSPRANAWNSLRFDPARFEPLCSLREVFLGIKVIQRVAGGGIRACFVRKRMLNAHIWMAIRLSRCCLGMVQGCQKTTDQRSGPQPSKTKCFNARYAAEKNTAVLCICCFVCTESRLRAQPP